MSYNNLVDLQNAMSPSTVMSIYDDTNTETVNQEALAAVLNRACAQINSYIARNYPNLTLPVAADGGGHYPETLKAAELEFAIVYSRDRKPEYWSKSQENERQNRIKGAFEMAERYAKAEQQLYDSAEPKPRNVGGYVNPVTVTNTTACVKPKYFSEGTGDF